MEGDSTSLIFDFNFDDEVHLIENPHSQAHPSQRNIIILNLSHENNAENGSSTGTASNLPESNSNENLTASAHANSKEKLTASAHTNTGNLDASNECAPNVALAPQMPSTVTVQANQNSAEESSEFQSEAAGERNQAVEIGDQANASILENNLPDSGNNAHGSQESSSNLQPLANVAELSPSVTSTLNTSLSVAPTMNNENLGSSSNGFRSSNSMAEMMPQLGRVPAFNSENEINPNSNQLDTPAENLIQNNNLLNQWMNPLNLSTPLGADQLAHQNVGSNDFISNNQQALPRFQSSFLQRSTGLGNLNQQLQNWFSNQNATYTPLTPSRPQVNPFLDPDVFDSQFANSMSPGSFLPTRPLHSANDPASENLLHPFSMTPEQSILSRRPQHLPLSANVKETPGRTNIMMPTASMPLSLRPPQFPQLSEQINQAAVTLDLSNLQPASPLHLKNSLLQRTEQLSDDQGSLTLGQLMPNVIDPTQYDNSLLLRQSSVPSRAQNLDLQGLLNQPIRPIPTCPTHGTSVQRTNQLLNSPTQTDLFGGHNSPGSTPQLELSLLNRNNESFLGRRNRATSLYDIGESSSSSSSSKRSKISNHLETGSTYQSRASELDHLFASNPFNLPRPVRNALYDPVFESLGLPIDPHLRLFNTNN